MRLNSPLLAFALCLGLFLPWARATEDLNAWTLSSQRDGVTIYSRIRPGSKIKEFKAVGEFKAAPEAVLAVLDDIPHYPKFMPYVVECRLLKREGDMVISYQRIAPPLCSERDYTLKVQHETKSLPGGNTFIRRWELANGLGPPERPGIVRVTVDEGSWTLEPGSNHTTQATYRIYTDSGGALPAFIANKANQVGMGKLFEAIRKQVAK